MAAPKNTKSAKPASPMKAAPPRSRAGANETAVRATLKRLEVSPTTDAVGRLAVTLAMTLDEGAGMAIAAVSRELRASMSHLEARSGGTEDDLDIFLAGLSPSVVHSED